MAVCTINFYAKSLGTYADVEVLLPEVSTPPYGVLYLFHGLGGDRTTWRRCLPLARLAERLPLLVVMPDAGKSYYCNEPGLTGLPYEDHIVKDVIGLVDRTFPTIPERRGRVAAGVSMGGYGAMMLALRHPDVFCAASSHSGSLYFSSRPHPQGKKHQDALAAALPPGQYDCFALAAAGRQTTAAMPPLAPAIRFDCGTSDFLLPVNREFHEHLDKLALPHEYHEYEGGHDWKYWEAHFGETLEFAVEQVQT